MGPDLLANLDHGVPVLAAMLRGGRAENAMLGLGLLDSLLAAVVTLNAADARALQTLLPDVDRLATHPRADLAALAVAVRLGLATRSSGGAATSAGGAAAEPAAQAAREARAAEEQFAAVLRDLQDAQLPVRAYACMQLKKLVLARAPIAARNIPYLVGLFTTQLADPESYLYLAAINGLVALGGVHADATLPVLLREFACVQSFSRSVIGVLNINPPRCGPCYGTVATGTAPSSCA